VAWCIRTTLRSHSIVGPVITVSGYLSRIHAGLPAEWDAATEPVKLVEEICARVDEPLHDRRKLTVCRRDASSLQAELLLEKVDKVRQILGAAHIGDIQLRAVWPVTTGSVCQ
jgi:hypothetical protein